MFPLNEWYVAGFSSGLEGKPVAPATYALAWPYRGLIDRWQGIDFHVTYLAIWTGAVDANTDALDDPNRGGLHMRGFTASRRRPIPVRIISGRWPLPRIPACRTTPNWYTTRPKPLSWKIKSSSKRNTKTCFVSARRR